MPAWVVSASESAERDRAAIESGTPSRVLMERAGTAAANEIERRFRERLRNGAVVFAGPGNNGGDGWVVASTLARSGVDVSVIDFAGPRLKSPESIAFRAEAIGAVRVVESAPDGAGVVVDALLGTGFEGEPRGSIGEGIDAINAFHALGARVAALDVPSGLDSTTGAHSTCVVADVTLSFGGIKRGTLIARDCCGEIVALDIGLHDSAPVPGRGRAAPVALPQLVDSQWVRSRIPPIHFGAHKGTRKHLAILGGGKGMPGAVVLATKAALRSGAGLVRTFVASENLPAIVAAVPSALSSEWPATEDQTNAEISKWADAAVIGPGLGKSDSTRQLVEQILRNSRIPVLLDADALNVFAGSAKDLGALLAGRQALVTPHVAEFARLTGVDTREVLANRFDIGTDLAHTLNCTVLLKGSPTVIFAPNGTRFVVPRGTAALGTGGSGDLLAGIAGTLLAQIGDATIAACCAAWVHGRAAELCEYVRGTTLEDVLYALPRAWNELEPVPAPPVLTLIPAVAR
ncbi:MAG: NAD(P)H-hydrate dehydratase [Gemmatimonadaceae bacterium]